LNVHRVSDVRQIEIHTAEPLVPDPSPFNFEFAVANMKRYKSQGSYDIPAEVIQPEGEILRSNFHNFINCIWNKDKLPNFVEGVYYLHQFTRWVINLTVVIIGGHHCYQVHTKFYQIFFFHD
jgi:hypothetical protein